MHEDDTLTTEQAGEPAPADDKPSDAEAPENLEDEAKTETDDTDDDDSGDAEPGDDTDDSSEDDRPRKTSRSQRQKRAMTALRAENEDLRRRLDEREAGTRKDAEGNIEVDIGPEPKESDFEDWFDFQAAKAAYQTEKRIAKRDAERAAREGETHRQRQQREAALAYQERVDEIRGVVTDFDEVIKAATFEISNDVRDLILESEKGPQLAYYLAKRPDLAADLSSMGAVRAAREIGRIEARLSLPKPKKQTQAPAPAGTVRGGAAAPFDPKTASMDDYVAWRKKQESA